MFGEMSLSPWILISLAIACGKNGGAPVTAADVRWALDALTGDSTAGQTDGRLKKLADGGYVDISYVTYKLRQNRGMSSYKPRYSLSVRGSEALGMWARSLVAAALWRLDHGIPEYAPITRPTK